MAICGHFNMMISADNRGNRHPSRKADPGTGDAACPEWTPFRDRAVRRLERTIRTEKTTTACRWSALDQDGTEIIDINHLLLLAAAWLEVDVEMAARLASDTVRLLSRDGELWARYRPGGTPDPVGVAAWPRLIQTVALIWERKKSAEFLHPLMPHLGRYLQWALDYFDPHGTGCPAWPSREEAFAPDSFDPHISTPDPSLFLLAEISAFETLKSRCIDPTLSRLVFDLEKTLLQEILQTEFWDSGRHVMTFVDTRDDSRIEAPRLFTLLSMVAADKLPAIMLRVRPQIRHWVRPGSFDPLQGPEHTAGHPHFTSFMLISLQQQREAMAGARLKSALRASRLARMDAPSPDAEELNATEGLASRHAPLPMASVAEDALTILATRRPGEQEFPLTPRERVLQTLNRHPCWALGTPIGLLTTAVFVLILIMLRMPAPTGSQLEAQLGLAKHYTQTGRYEEAVRLYERMLEDSPGLLAARLMKANTLYLKGDYTEASALYSELMEEDDVSPLIALDLVLALKKAGEDEAARRVFSEFRERHEANYPAEIRRTRRALTDLDDPSLSPRPPVQAP